MLGQRRVMQVLREGMLLVRQGVLVRQRVLVREAVVGVAVKVRKMQRGAIVVNRGRRRHVMLRRRGVVPSLAVEVVTDVMASAVVVTTSMVTVMVVAVVAVTVVVVPVVMVAVVMGEVRARIAVRMLAPLLALVGVLLAPPVLVLWVLVLGVVVPEPHGLLEGCELGQAELAPGRVPGHVPGHVLEGVTTRRWGAELAATLVLRREAVVLTARGVSAAVLVSREAVGV